MSAPLDPIRFPLSGSRLIEASAGTGKTWTIAALYVRLVLGHGDAAAFARPLLPAEILVMTFTRAATQELSDRIRRRLVQAARCFRGEQEVGSDPFLQELIAAYPDNVACRQAAHRLMLAAEGMDDAAVFTIDAWCQRMLREHAFDSGCLFDEELIASEDAVRSAAVRDYWRRHVYALDARGLERVQACWPNLPALEKASRELVRCAPLFTPPAAATLQQLIAVLESEQQARLAPLKAGWAERADTIQEWMDTHRSAMNGSTIQARWMNPCFQAIRDWATTPYALFPDEPFHKHCHKLDPAYLQGIRKDKNAELDVPGAFAQVKPLRDALAQLEPIDYQIQRHAAVAIAARIAELKQHRHQFGFADMLTRLRAALEGPNAEALRARIIGQYPVALIDEFQDTSPDQYRIFDLLYRVQDNSNDTGLFLIGDPKQAIYGFRGADIFSYLAARRATEGRHYHLAKNFRSTHAFVQAVNRLFLHAEGDATAPGHAGGAFLFRNGQDNPLPFTAVGSQGRPETLVDVNGAVPALGIWCNTDSALDTNGYRTHFAALCAEKIVTLLNDPAAGFIEEGQLTRIKPADVAILVRDRYEADAVRDALQAREVPSAYLSDKDSVFQTIEAADLLMWLQAVANPLDANAARAAFATRSAGLTLEQMAQLATDDAAWDERLAQLKALRTVWQRQGILAMLRRFIHELALPARLLREPGGERRLTDVLHLAEMLQAASRTLDGEHALIRWLSEQIDDDADSGDERIRRLESDAQLVKVVTVHKSKGLEYPLVFLPFAITSKSVTRRNRTFIEYMDDEGQRLVDFALSGDALQAVQATRMEEDVRLLYVALTRARHALWMGVTSLDGDIHTTAFGYLLAGGDKVGNDQLPERLQAMCAACPSIHIEEANAPAGLTRLARDRDASQLVRAPLYDAQFERRWSIASYTSITKDVGATHVPTTATEEKLLDEESSPAKEETQDAPWHRFPRGALPGQFVHAQLEWIANEGFAIAASGDFPGRVHKRCERAGWEHRQEETAAWLQAAVTTPLPPFNAALSQLDNIWAEMEFWVPAADFAVADLDQLCQRHLLDGRARPALQARQLRGMLRGFKDLVCEWGGRYWVLDYKTTSLGRDDAAYHERALADAVAAHRYDVQGTIYQLALHRLLKARLGDRYAPQTHLGGTVFYFLRGVGNAATRGCYLLAPDAALIEAADALLSPAAMEETGV
ncbi:MAG TPA: exodeoxyribonuclease V subunit beta [Noviherbaspirillum sp.]|nr:exodeoxyribonuclease V subunit beta [Noviherbaspirillum sp.]